MPNLVSLTCPSLQILGKTKTGMFLISGFLIKENCHNSRTSDDIDMKLGTVTKLDKRNKTASKKLTVTSCRKIVASLSFLRFMAKFSVILKPDSGRTVCKTYIFINSNILFYKN